MSTAPSTERRSRALKPLWLFSEEPAAVDVVGLGECSLDTVALVDGIPPPGAKVSVAERLELPGGQVASALLALERLGLRTALVGAVGDDVAGEAALAPLRKAGMDLSGVRVVSGAQTRSALVLVDRRTGERTVLGHRDERLSLDAGDLVEAEVIRGRVLHVDASDLDAAIWAADCAQRRGIPVVLDADAPVPGIEPLLARVDFPIVSLDFAEESTGANKPEACVRGLVAAGARFAVVTLGDQGALGGGADQELVRVPGLPVRVRDTTGAGDVFHAGFVFGLLRGLEPREVLRVANTAAALSCRAVGAQGALPTRDELQAALAAGPAPID